MGEDIIELQTSQRRLKLYEQIGRRLALSQLQLAEPEDRTLDERKQALHRDMEHFIRSYKNFYLEELHSAFVFTAYEYCEISAFLPTMIRDAQANTSWPCRFANSWLSDIPLVEKAPQALPRAAPAVQLLEKLEQTTTTLSQKVRLVYHRHGLLLEDLEGLGARLAEMKERPLPSDPASVEDLEQQSVDFALLAIFSKELQRHVPRLADDVWLLLGLVERHRCIEFSPAEGDLMPDMHEIWKRLYEIVYEWWTPGMDVDEDRDQYEKN